MIDILFDEPLNDLDMKYSVAIDEATAPHHRRSRQDGGRPRDRGGGALRHARDVRFLPDIARAHVSGAKARPGDIHTHVFAQQFSILDDDGKVERHMFEAQEINRPELGTLGPGKPADIAVLAMDEGDFSFVDCERTTMTGDKRLRCEMTFFGGEIVYNPSGRGWPSWEQDQHDNPTPLRVRSQSL